MRAKISAPEPPLPSPSSSVSSPGQSGKQAFIRAGKTLRMDSLRAALRVQG